MNFKHRNAEWNCCAFPAKIFLMATVLTGLGLLLAGCGNGSLTAGTSQVRVFNAYIAPAGADSSVAVTSNGNSLTGGANAPFGQLANSGLYATVPSGKFVATGQPAGTSETLAFQHPVTLVPTDNYTVVAAGEAGQTDTFVPRLITLPHISTTLAPIPSGDVAVRVVNLSLNTNSVSLYTANSGTPAALDPGVINIPYGYNGQTNAYVYLPAAKPANLALVDSGTQNVLTLSSSSNLTSNIFTAGQAYTLVVYGQPGNSAQPLGATWIVDQPSP